jgi:hypothetical protein
VRYGVNPVPRIKKRDASSITASELFHSLDSVVLYNATKAILGQGGAVMIGQTRDQSKLILTVYLDGEQDKEYCEDVQDVINFLGQYQV